MKVLEAKRAFFVFRLSSQDQKCLSDNIKLLIPLACEILLKYFWLLFKNYY